MSDIRALSKPMQPTPNTRTLAAYFDKTSG